jgi:hypothetical protein
VTALAQETDPEAVRRANKRLEVEGGVERGQRADIILEAPGLSIDAPVQHLVWRGDPQACGFIVTLPPSSAGRVFHPRVLVLIRSAPVCVLKFTLRAAAENAKHPISRVRAHRYDHAFLSYAALDREQVVASAQILKAVRINFFHDLLSLEPGESWERRLYEEIDRCDLFLLFWSSHARASEWVLKEIQYALARRKSSDDERPDIVPVILEGPPPPSPPEFMKDIHFNDSLVYVLAGVRGAKSEGAEKHPQD